MSARDMRMEMFLRALLRRDFSKAKGHLEKLQKMAGSDEWGRGYTRAINGFLSTLQDNDPDSFLFQVVSNNDRERAEEFLKRFEEIISQEFRDEYEKGYYTAWVELLRAYLNQKSLA
ncbi:hypothetical protein [Thermococcus sp. Bubb.Bath]|uniref:hypothetical protein n=1 Tax=Thermococcus sp. Bubb.Bath TaxID=1638242 RepID=UPI00143A02C2|nr:hypothetical protein [Thermococcus sp. Bubb.Bath]